MSAYMVSDRHISAIINTAWKLSPEGENPFGDYSPEEVGEILKQANVESLEALYEDTDGFADRSPFQHDSEVSVDALSFMKMIACFKYQACEYEGWEMSEAKELLERVVWYAVESLREYARAAGTVASDEDISLVVNTAEEIDRYTSNPFYGYTLQEAGHVLKEALETERLSKFGKWTKPTRETDFRYSRRVPAKAMSLIKRVRTIWDRLADLDGWKTSEAKYILERALWRGIYALRGMNEATRELN